MALPLPNLDDRHFEQLLEDAKQRIKEKCPEWDDCSVHDPGIVLLEVFVYLTDVMLYRLNRLPEKVYVELLNLLGVKLIPPRAAEVTLRFSLDRPKTTTIEIPRGTRVTIGRASGTTEPPIFVTEETRLIEPGETQKEVQAFHCTPFIGELVGTGNGKPQQMVKAKHIPIMASNNSDLNLKVGIETDQQDLAVGDPALPFQGKVYRLWEEVENFSSVDSDRYVYVVDRMFGTILFAPALHRKEASTPIPIPLAQVPPLGKEIRLWYGSGGGRAGNIPAQVLTVMKDPISGVQVTNIGPATGGREGESLENALRRGPLELHSLQRAVTAKDFEVLAEKCSGSVARAKAMTMREVWKHAQPGTVEILLVPSLPELPESQSSRVTLENLQSWQTEDVRLQVQEALEQRRPLGTTCITNWVSFKTVTVHVEAVVFKGEDVGAVKHRLEERLHQMINPLPTSLQVEGWEFGQPLRKSQVEYELIRSEAGVSYLNSLRMYVADVPSAQVHALVADVHQAHLWYAGSQGNLFRTQNNGASWELVKKGEEDKVVLVRIHPERPGIVAFTTNSALTDGRTGTCLHVSLDCGDTWSYYQAFDFETFDMTWLLRGEVPVLLMATEKGLFELSVGAHMIPVQVIVNSDEPNMGLYAIVAYTHGHGVYVAVSARSLGGVYLSAGRGVSGTFHPIGLQDQDVRVLVVQSGQVGIRAWLWAGVKVPGNEEGKGCYRWELQLGGMSPGQTQTPLGNWESFEKKWKGGSCLALAFDGQVVLASTYEAGVMRLDLSATKQEWKSGQLDCGLPLRDEAALFHPVYTIGVGSGWVLAGGPQGIFRSGDQGGQFNNCSNTEYMEKVPLPPTWLLCSGDHQVTVMEEGESFKH